MSRRNWMPLVFLILLLACPSACATPNVSAPTNPPDALKPIAAAKLKEQKPQPTVIAQATPIATPQNQKP